MPAPDHRATLERFFAREAPPPVVSAYLFGSHAEGRAHRESDVDVAVVLDYDQAPTRQERFDHRVRLGSALIRALHVNDVDLVVLNDTPPLLARRILSEGKLLYCADPEADRVFERNVRLRAADLEPFLLKHRQTLIEALRR
jgi:predicted nucleotidyltransferase